MGGREGREGGRGGREGRERYNEFNRSVKFSGITSPIRPPTLRNITSYSTFDYVRRSMTSHMT